MNVDQEWMELILQAKRLGLTMEEIQAFLRGNSQLPNMEDLMATV